MWRPIFKNPTPLLQHLPPFVSSSSKPPIIKSETLPSLSLLRLCSEQPVFVSLQASSSNSELQMFQKMDSTFFSSSSKQFLSDQEENDNATTSTPENSSDSPPPSTNFSDYSKITTSTSSPRKSARRAIQKRVVSVPIKGDNSNSNTQPPSDSWAWRKYGQKPIKGSPYPRGYYRCSSSKGCPARKQVERSRVDPTTLVITYSSEHNHPWPASRNHHNNHNNSSSAAATKRGPTKTEAPEAKQPDHQDQDLDQDQDSRFADLNHDSLILNDEFVWFVDMETTSSRVLESPIFAESSSSVGSDSADKAAMVFPMGEEDELLFADLGELPECSFVFRHRGVGPQAQIC